MAAEALIYLHGGPGSPDELNLFDGVGLDVDYAPDRFVLFVGCKSAEAFDRLANDIDCHFPRRPLHLVGFSMGGYVALELAYRLEKRVARIDLIAPAAPLEGGDFLNKMAGRALFSIAQRHPVWLGIATIAQRVLAQFLPSVVYKMLYANAVGLDRALAKDPKFKAQVIAMLRQCYGKGAAGLEREITSYVRPWAGILPSIIAPVTLWQGSVDNWVLPEMADFLAQSMPNVQLRKIPGASHYTTLRYAFCKLQLSLQAP
jgi:pimeloyl-ACP methyl ester carboxylesterase